MAREHIRLAIEAERQVQGFASAAAEMRSIPILTTEAISLAFERGGQQASAARRSLKGIYERTPPHLLGLPCDEHITGKVGGRAPLKRPLTSAGSGTAANQVNGSTLQLLVPVSRAIRPMNALGQTSFHFSFEMITTNHVDFGLTTKSGRRARPDEHGKYLEDEEKRAVEPVIVPIDPDSFAHYQEREQALALAEQECVFSSIEGDREDRIALFRAAGESEKSNRPPTLKVDIRTQSPLVGDFLAQAWNDETLAEAMTKTGFEKVGKWSKKRHEAQASDKFIEDFCNLTFSGEDALAAHTLLNRLGWREEWQNPLAYQSHGIEWDTGKSGRIQMRCVGEIPHELDRDGRSRFLKSLAARFDALGVPYVLVMHRPTADNHEKNWHFHLIYWDRPAERFDPETVQQRLDAGEAEVARYSKRNIKYLEAALSDSKVQAQAGRFDFEVEYTYTDAKGRERTVYPFKQNKNRECTRTDFVPDLRAFIADISNRELERANASRRVCASKYTEMDIPKKPDQHLNDAANRQELSGQSTREGSANETRQWDYLQLMLDRQLEQEKNDLTPAWSKLRGDFKEAGASDAIISRVEGEWLSLKLAEVKLRDQARRAAQLADRLLSRPGAMANESYNHVEAVLNGTASRKVKSKRDFHLKRLQILNDHTAGLKELFREEFALELRLEAQADELSKQATSLLEAHGLGCDLLFPAGLADKPASAQKQAATNSAKPVQPVAPQATPTKVHQSAAIKDLSKQLDIIADKRVPYTIKEETLANGESALIAVIAPRDQALYGLPNTVVAKTPHAVSRLVNIHAARVQSATVPSARVAEVHAPETLTDRPELVTQQRVASETSSNVAQETPVAGDASKDSSTDKIDNHFQSESEASQERHGIAAPSEGKKHETVREVEDEATTSAATIQEDAPADDTGSNHDRANTRARTELEELDEWNAANINSIKTRREKGLLQEMAAAEKPKPAPLAEPVDKASEEGCAPKSNSVIATETRTVFRTNANEVPLSQADRNRMAAAPLYLVKTREGEIHVLGRDVPLSLATAATSGQHAQQFDRWYRRQEEERREITQLFAQSPYSNSRELEAGVNDGGADLRLSMLWARWTDSHVLKQAIDQGLEMRRKEEREVALKREQEREQIQRAAMAQHFGQGI
ncbi:hypothetical protein A3723_10750 [Erythrobacter sp. HI0028]|nr:hypothetical protein A3723_10750 [Erythrobacter sp. HI0028]